MISYLIRRVLLFVPTIIGATFIIFMLLALAPQSVIDQLLPPTGEMQAGSRELRMAYIEDRYGLDQPAPVRYLKWLNNVSPIGFRTWAYDDPKVIEQRQKRREWRETIRPEVRAQVEQELANQLAPLRAPTDDEQLAAANRGRASQLIEEAERRKMRKLEKEQGFWPLPGNIKWNRIPIKAPDLGDSFTKSRPVWPLIAEALPVTLLLNALAIPLAVAISMMTGIWSAKHRGLWQDWGTGAVLLALYSIPVIWVGVMAIGFLASEQFVKWFPPTGMHDIQAESMAFLPQRIDGQWQPGYLFDTLWHLSLPVICLSYVQFAFLSKLARTAVLETLGSDYIRTAHAKGLPPNVVLLRHGVRNSLIPIITFLASLLPYIVTGSIVVEVIFGINGMGRLVIDALKGKDYELFLSTTLMVLILTLISYLLADIAYVLADPRVSYSSSGS